MNQESGFYGKVPTHSDFIRHNLPRAFIDPWDDWLQSAFAASKAQLNEAWLETYLTSPIYRFVLTPSLCGEVSRIGIMMPSVDKIGRYYPFVLAAGLDNAGSPFDLLKRYEEWFEGAQKLALSALEDGFELDALIPSMTTLDALLKQPPSATDALPSTDANDAQGDFLLIHETLDSPSQLDALYPKLLHKTLCEVCQAYSLWWTAGSENITPSLLISQGFPPTANIAAMLSGDWAKWGWMDEEMPPQLITTDDENDDEDEPWVN
jgi:type VI secretion system protein ImpM